MPKQNDKPVATPTAHIITQLKNQVAPKTENKPHFINSYSEFFPHFYAAAIATPLIHPLRVAMNLAPNHKTPLAVIKQLPQYWYKGLAINLSRGTLAVTAQSASKKKVEASFPKDSNQGKLAGCIAATFAGTAIALLIETPFIRKTTLNPKDVAHSSQKIAFTRFSWQLALFYSLREAGFSLVGIGGKDLLKDLFYPALAVAAVESAAFHKAAALEATADVELKQGTRPNFSREGFKKALQQLAQGKTYTHPSYQAPFKNPSTTEGLKNVLAIFCSPNMIFFRILYLAAFQQIYSRSLEKAPTEIKKITDFWSGSKPTEEQAIQNIENKASSRSPSPRKH